MARRSTVPKSKPKQEPLFLMSPPSSRRLSPGEWRTLTLNTVIPEAQRLGMKPVQVQDVYQLFLDAQRPQPAVSKWWFTEAQARTWATRALNEAVKAGATPHVVARGILYAIASGKRRPEPN